MVDLNLEPLFIKAESRRKTLVRSKAKEQNTKNNKVTKPEFTALLRMSAEETKEAAKQTNVAPAKIRSGAC